VTGVQTCALPICSIQKINDFTVIAPKINGFYKDLNINKTGNLSLFKFYYNKLFFNLDLEKKNISDHVFLKGFVDNIQDYMFNSDIFVLSSLWEDPGFVLLEASYMNITILSSNCPNGPTEILQEGLGGFLFNSNNKENFVKEFDNFFKSSKQDLKTKLIKSKIYSKKFTKFHHYLQIKKILDI
jgi:glycosyltransferase involved in cell wall biosynthesis